MMLHAYMSFVGIIGALLFYVQAYKIFTNKAASNVSLLGFAISLYTAVNWFAYGVYTENYPLILSGSLGGIGCTLVLIGIYRYGRNK